MHVHYQSATGGVAFDDTVDHFENALLRLAIARPAFQPWLDAAGRHAGSIEERLRAGFAEVRPECAPVAGGARVGGGALVFPSIAENAAYGVAVDDARQQGWLVRRGSDGWIVEREPPLYEESYFEGGGAGAGR